MVTHSRSKWRRGLCTMILKENLANKATTFETLNNTLYPTTQAVANYIGSLGYGLTTNRIDQNNAATTSTQFASVITNETGTGNVVLSDSPTLSERQMSNSICK